MPAETLDEGAGPGKAGAPAQAPWARKGWTTWPERAVRVAPKEISSSDWSHGLDTFRGWDHIAEQYGRGGAASLPIGIDELFTMTRYQRRVERAAYRRAELNPFRVQEGF